ncbi:ATP-binding protein [Hungatella hominis]|uniref:ATP-binding protein n=1 Tax=Hungatella hominis TaxID=2763050 RepID=UPI0032E39A0A
MENDRIEILSFPGPDRSVTMEGLKSYRVSNRRYRNRRIGDFLKELHLTEGRNTGFKKILDSLEANGPPKPEFETDEARSYFITRLFIHEGFWNTKYEDENVSTPNSTSSTPNSTPSHTLLEDLRGLSLREQILVLIKKNSSISKKKMTEILGVSMYALKKELAAMSEEHVAEFVGFSRSGKWIVH